MMEVQLTENHLNDEVKGFSIRLPEKFHNLIKAQAALEGKNKDEKFKELLIEGWKQLHKHRL